MIFPPVHNSIPFFLFRDNQQCTRFALAAAGTVGKAVGAPVSRMRRGTAQLQPLLKQTSTISCTGFAAWRGGWARRKSNAKYLRDTSAQSWRVWFCDGRPPPARLGLAFKNSVAAAALRADASLGTAPDCNLVHLRHVRQKRIGFAPGGL